jgi:hypothetical protein
MRKIVVIIVMMLLIGTTILPLASSTDKNKDENIQIMSNLPDYFNWHDYEGEDWTTPAKDQRLPQWCGNGVCWLFAAIGALESVIKIRSRNADLDPDLSEQYVLSCLSMAGNCEGGSFGYKVFQFIKRDDSTGNYCNGIIPEFCFPFQADDNIPCSNKTDDWEDHLIPILDYSKVVVRGTPEDIVLIKTIIMDKGPVVAGMMFDDGVAEFVLNNHDPNDYYSCIDVTGANHEVDLVGWKDDPSIGNGGYWIIRDSWGPDIGYDGFWNLEYGGQNIDSTDISWVSLFPTFLNCEGSVSIVDIKPGETINGSFTVENIGSPFSNLEWEVNDWPDWGEWTFESYEGSNLTPEDGQITIDVSVVVPDEKNQVYMGNITLINKGLESDYEIIPITITTSKNKSLCDFNPWISRIIERFPILELLI